MTTRSKVIAGVVAAVVVVGGGILALTVFKEQFGGLPIIGDVVDNSACPMTGAEPADDSRRDRPAVAIKVENATVAYPLSGLQRAEIVYEEVVEGGVTRFMAMYHCNDATKVGPVRSARVIDPAIMLPITRILGYSGENAPVRAQLERDDIVRIDESSAKGSMRRIEREGISSEHTLYADTEKDRELGRAKFDEAPPDELFTFGDLEGDPPEARQITINFSALTRVRYVYTGEGYERFQPVQQPFEMEGAGQLEIENVLIEEHEVNNSTKITDIEGNPSTEIADETGSGRAVLFRDGRVIEGTWSRDSRSEFMQFQTEGGDEMVFSEGAVWVHLVPSKKGEVKGSFSFD